ncbi:MAG TPA: PP2C family protein-serine/threonine phosphatase [Verrucomicrobiae bacterium]|nr:PP2C family protein-serine/threonine phosphatase [Verrucomicrobiae bacterium]
MSTFHFNVNSSARVPSTGPANPPIPMHPEGWEHPLARMREAQRRMWPSGRPNIPGLDYHAGWRTGALPGASAGRAFDYLDYFEMDGGNLGLAIGEVAGDTHAETGAAAALLLSSLHALVRSMEAQSDASVATLVRSIHDVLYDASPESGSATLFVARYDPIEHRLDYCNAGQAAPVLLRQAGSRRRAILLENGGPMVGVLRRSAFRQGSIRLQPGDILAAFTAGLTDAVDSGGEVWGYRRLLAAIESAAQQPARDIVGRVFEEVRCFTGSSPRTRDMTLWVGRIEQAMATSPELELAAEEPAETAVLAA